MLIRIAEKLEIKEKLCSNCNQLLSLPAYEIKKQRGELSYRANCKECRKKQNDKYIADHKQDISKYGQQRYEKNKDIILEKAEIYYNNNREKVKQRSSEYYKNHKDELRETKRIYKKNRRATDPAFNLRNVISSTVYLALKKQGSCKNNISFLQHIGYTIQELKQHLEKQFEPWMNWGNYGTYVVSTWNDNDLSTWKWNIDHIIPQSRLLYTSMTDDNFKKCWALNNLRPLSAKENLIKKDK